VIPATTTLCETLVRQVRATGYKAEKDNKFRHRNLVTVSETQDSDE